MRKIVFFVAALCWTASVWAAPVPQVTVVSTYTGTYSAQQSSSGVIEKWTLYSDKTFTGSWRTEKNSYSLQIKGRYDTFDSTIVFEGSGSVVVFGRGTYQTRISGSGRVRGDSLVGGFILFVDQDGFWGDAGSFTATRTEPSPAQ